MKIKLDENLPAGAAPLLRAAGHDVDTAIEEGLAGADDAVVLTAATNEDRALVTLDTDFANVRRYPIGAHAGIVVLRLRDQRWRAVKVALDRLAKSGILQRLKGGLAIVSEARIRLRQGK